MQKIYFVPFFYIELLHLNESLKGFELVDDRISHAKNVSPTGMFLLLYETVELKISWNAFMFIIVAKRYIEASKCER